MKGYLSKAVIGDMLFSIHIGACKVVQVKCDTITVQNTSNNRQLMYFIDGHYESHDKYASLFWMPENGLSIDFNNYPKEPERFEKGEYVLVWGNQTSEHNAVVRRYSHNNGSIRCFKTEGVDTCSWDNIKKLPENK